MENPGLMVTKPALLDATPQNRREQDGGLSIDRIA